MLCVRNDYLDDIIRWFCNFLCTASEVNDSSFIFGSQIIHFLRHGHTGFGSFSVKLAHLSVAQGQCKDCLKSL